MRTASLIVAGRLAPAAWTALACVLIALHGHLAQTSAWAFLYWNLLLAWLPLAFVWLAGRARRTPAGLPLAGLALALWLLFLPNAPYIVTDGVHLLVDHPRLPALAWAMTGAAAVAGMLCGFRSLLPLHAAVVRRGGRALGALFAGSVLAASAVGIYLGRALRWNSWDILARPEGVLRDAGRLLLDPGAAARTVAFAVALVAAYAVWLRVVEAAAPAPVLRRPRA